MKNLVLAVVGIILFALLAVYVIIPAAVVLFKVLIAAGICAVFALGFWIGYLIGKRKK